MLAYAITIHKYLGLTLDRIVIDLGDKELARECICVALVRPKKLQDILLVSLPFGCEKYAGEQSTFYSLMEQNVTQICLFCKYYLLRNICIFL